jgi:ATPase subunit of ABC transporter with duplicated ATPase domains
MASPNVLNIKALNLDIIQPSTAKMYDPEQGGSKIVVVGKPGTGKTTLIASILYAKKHIFPVGLFMSGSEDSNGFYRRIAPSTFVFNDYSEEQL